MLCCKGRYNKCWIIKKISLRIQVRIRNPVINIFNGFSVSPEKFNSFCIAITIVVYCSLLPISCIVLKDRHIFYKKLLF